MSHRKPRPKMRLHREVLVKLSSEQTGQVAGGISVGTCTACLETYCVCASQRCRPSNNPWAC